jgi:predicted ATP-binding protein involved in virulence
MKLVSINIEKLFGKFDYSIKLNQEEDITILTGPNGYGKTTILKLIYNILRSPTGVNPADLPLSSISFFLSDGNEIIIRKIKNDEWYFKSNGKEQSGKIISIYANIMPVYFIKDQRLEINNDIQNGPTVSIYSYNLRELIFKIQTEEKKLADELAPSLTKRFKDYKTILSASEYQERFKKLSQKYRKLQEYGIYQNDLESTEYEGDDKRFFSLNLEDWEKKTAVYDDLLLKLDLFITLLNDKGLTNKKAAVKSDSGFVFTTLDEQKLELPELSSGEQNEVILLYELLFKAEPNSLVLIDEPETSMHVAWQYEFIHDLEKIAAIKPFSFFIATHSPDIINDKDSIDLYKLINGESDDANE